MSDPARPASAPRKVFAAILDFFTIFIVGGDIIGKMTGESTDGGFNLEGGPALLLFALIVVYFVVGRKYAGGTFWQRILRAY